MMRDDIRQHLSREKNSRNLNFFFSLFFLGSETRKNLRILSMPHCLPSLSASCYVLSLIAREIARNMKCMNGHVRHFSFRLKFGHDDL